MVLPTLCQAQDLNDELTARERLTTSRGLALGNNMVASASGTSAVWHNPAAISSAMMYAMDATYRYGNRDTTHGFQLNLLDMKSNEYIGAEIGYIYEHSEVAGSTQHYNHARLGLAVPLANNILSLGVTGAYEHIKLGGKKHLSQFTMDVGLMVRPVDWLAIGFSAQNLIVGDYKNIMPRMISTGVAFGSLQLGLNLMFEASFNISAEKDHIADTGSYGVGVEYVIKNMFPIRAGYRYEVESEQHVVSAGLAFRDSSGKVGLDVGYQHTFENHENDIFQAGLSLYF